MSAAVATRPDAGFSLWARDPQGTWHHFGNGSQQELELKAMQAVASVNKPQTRKR